jgi:hypothetical protein
MMGLDPFAWRVHAYEEHLWSSPALRPVCLRVQRGRDVRHGRFRVLIPGFDDCDGAAGVTCATALWSKRFGQAGSVTAYDLAVGPAGEVVFVAALEGTVDFGGGPLTSSGAERDFVLVKLSADGTWAWQRQIPCGTNDESLPRVAVDGGGNVVFTVGFSGAIDPGSGPITSAGILDILLARYDAGGTLLWSKHWGDAALQIPLDVGVDSTGAVLLTGGIDGTVDYGGGPLAVNGDYDVLLAKYDPAGGHIFSKRFGNAAEQIGVTLGVAANDDVVLAGSFESTLDFGSGPIQSAGSFDYFLARFGPDGSSIYSKRFGDGGYQFSNSLALSVTASGEAVLAGSLEGALDFGGGALMSAGSADVFVAGFGASGAHVFSKRFGDGTSQRAYGVAHFDPGRIAITGAAQGTSDLGGGPLVSAGGFDALLGTLEAATGAPVWSRLYGDAAGQRGIRVARAPTNHLVVLGTMGGTVDLGNGPLTTVGTSNIFLAKIAP